MIDELTLDHLARIKSALFDTYSLNKVSKYVTEKTFLDGSRYSFNNHEFQEAILDDSERDINVQKCAQVGMSELLSRAALGSCRVAPYFKVIMTWPTGEDADHFVQTRIDPIILASPDLRSNVDPDLNNLKVKGFKGSILHFRGCNSPTSAFSVPADMLIHDEVDKSSAAVLQEFQSRLQHSSYGLTRNFSTPTSKGVGISAMMDTSRRYHHMVKCHCCNHLFIPNLLDHIVVPDFGRGETLKTITKSNIGSIKYKDAYLECPRCGKSPSLQPEYREWVCENPDSNFGPKGYFVSPFSVPNLPKTSISALVHAISSMPWDKYCNQRLGLVSTENNDQITKDDLERSKHLGSLDSSNVHAMGIDVGQICHISVGRKTQEGYLLVVYRETCVLDDLKTRKAALVAKYRVIMTVIDTYPETQMVKDMQKTDKNLYGGQYHRNRKLAEFQIVKVDADEKKGKVPVDQVHIHMDINFDHLKALFKGDEARSHIIWAAQEAHIDQLFTDQCLDMRRKQELDTSSRQMVYVWSKSAAKNDHFFHSLGYLNVACGLMATSKGSGPAAGHTRVMVVNIPKQAQEGVSNYGPNWQVFQGGLR